MAIIPMSEQQRAREALHTCIGKASGSNGAALFFLVICGFAVLAACGGSGEHTLPQLTASSMRVTLKVPSSASLQARASRRQPAWISPAARSVLIGVSPKNAPANELGASIVKSTYDISPTSLSCTPAPDGRICAVTIPAPVGTDVVSVDLYDGPMPPSTPPQPAATSAASQIMPNHLGTTTVVSTIAANAVNPLAFTVGGLPATLVITPATIVFTPYPYVASNATPAPAATVLTTNVYVSAQDAAGVTIVGPDQYGSGIALQLYGPSPAPVTIAGSSVHPAQALLASPSQGQPLQLAYNTGILFTAPVSLVATSNGIAAATSLVVNNVTPSNASCTPAPDRTSLAVNFLNLNTYGALNPKGYRSASGYAYNGGLFRIPMSIGSPFPTGSPYPPTVAITIDTGSVGLAVSTDIFYRMMGLAAPPSPSGTTATPIPFPSSLPAGVTGPTGQGQITYTSDGVMEMGQFFTVPLNIFTDYTSTSPVAVTVPTQILVVTHQGCNPNYTSSRGCAPNSAAHDVQNMGIGFSPLDIATVNSPVANPFLQLAQELYGPIHRRYIINNRGMFFGGTPADLAGFQWVKLSANRATPGDWTQPSMCVAFPGQSTSAYTCGQMLVDTGLASMILNIPASQQNPKLATYITQNGPVHIIAPGPAASPLALDWTFNSPGLAPTPNMPPAYPAAIPNGMNIGFGTSDIPFINTSQRIIYAFDYAYDADCGAIGFRPAAPAPPAQP